MTSSVSAVYLHVIEDVITSVREEFISSGTGERILSELQALWETKMMHCGVISPNMERPSLQKQISPITSVHDLNAPPMEEYETPTAEMLFPPTPLQTPVPQTPLPQTPIQTPLPGTEQMYNPPTGLSDYAPADVCNGSDVKSGRPSLYITSPSSWMNQRTLGLDVNVAYVEGREEIDRVTSHHPATQDFFMMPSGKRKRDDYASHLTSEGFMPQQDGAGDMKIEFVFPKENQLSSSRLGCCMTTDVQPIKETTPTPVLPQQDGVHDEYTDLFCFQEVTNEDYNNSTPSEHADLRVTTPFVGTPKPSRGEATEDDEPPLNEDDDEDDLDDFDPEEEEPNTQHLVLAQFDKVTRTKSRWKCTLKDGIMHINSRDFLFNKRNYEHCQSKFHPSCARNAGLCQNIKSNGGRFQHKACCEIHSLEHREKANGEFDF